MRPAALGGSLAALLAGGYVTGGVATELPIVMTTFLSSVRRLFPMALEP
jgi:hypothetical protein